MSLVLMYFFEILFFQVAESLSRILASVFMNRIHLWLSFCVVSLFSFDNADLKTRIRKCPLLFPLLEGFVYSLNVW